MNDVDRAVVVYLANGMRMIGFVPANESMSDWQKKADQGCAYLAQAREFMVTRKQQVDPQTGAVIGLQVTAALIAMDIDDGPLEMVQVKPTAWYFVVDNKSMRAKVEALIQDAISREKMNKAVDSGIILPGLNPNHIPRVGGR